LATTKSSPPGKKSKEKNLEETTAFFSPCLAIPSHHHQVKEHVCPSFSSFQGGRVTGTSVAENRALLSKYREQA
jgi:hypothetical protein